jgi:hypothetical protein
MPDPSPRLAFRYGVSRAISADARAETAQRRADIEKLLIKFATRIPAFMYLTDFRENTLQDVITKLEPDLFVAVTGLTVKDFHLLVRLKVFNTEQMNQTVFPFVATRMHRCGTRASRATRGSHTTDSTTPW